MKINIKDSPALLLLLLPLAIISGPFFSDLFIIIIDLWFLNRILKDKDLKKKYINNNKIFLYFLIFNIYIIIVSLFSENLMFSLKSSFFYFRFYIFALAMCFIFDTFKFSIRYFFYSISFAIILILLSAQYELIVIKDYFNNTQENLRAFNRISGLFGDELIMGSVLKNFFVIFLVLFFYLNFNEKKYVNTWLILFIFFTITFTILISGERTSIFIYLIFSLISGFILRNKINFFKISVISCIAFIFLILNFDNLRSRVIDFTITQVTNNQVILDDERKVIERDKEKFLYLSVDHDAHARTAIEMFLEKPLFGYGPKNFRNVCKRFEYNRFSCTTHPHNIYLQILSETGLIGLFFLIVGILNLLNFLRNKFNKKDDISFKILTTYLLIFFIPFLPSGNFFNNFFNINLYMIIGLYLYFLMNFENNQK